LKSQKGLIGLCELEPGAHRAPWASLEAQRFRYLQRLNDLEIVTPDGEIVEPSAEHRARLIRAFEDQAEVTFNGMRKLLELNVPRGSDRKYTFNLEAGDEKKLKGNVTAARIKKTLGDEYDRLEPDVLERLIDDLIEYEKKEALARRLVNLYGLTPEKADELADVRLEEGYCALSRKALRRLLPLLEEGIPFATARKQVYGQQAGETPVLDELPPVLVAKPELRNPVVCRGLTELRKVVNALIREYGKPAKVRVELARDLKRSRRQRADLTKKNRDNEKNRDAARRKIEEKLRIKDPKPGDILKVRLAEECNWECPYTGKPIPIESLVGPSPQFDVEHIIPFSRSLDNSFANKTLCHHRENRDVKRNQTPYQAYGGNEQKYQEILARVRRFRGPAAHGKLRKFQQKELDADFAASQLQDTRYMSRLAAEYLGLLYGQVDPSGPRYVQVSPGRVTAYLRDEWGLNAILADGDADEKNREDHRHHAVDAVAIALSSPGVVQSLSASAAQAEQIGRRLFVPIDPPWPDFVANVRAVVDAINVSYRVNRRVRGKLHKDTMYSKLQKTFDKNGREVECRHIRKPLKGITQNQIEDIVDDTVKALVKQKLEKLGGNLKAFDDPNNLPYLKAWDGRIIPIKKVQIRETVGVISLGTPSSPRYVAPGSNHHMEIVAILDDGGNEKRWEGHIVPLYKAHQRLGRREPVVQRDHGPRKCFRFSLAEGEYVEMEHEHGKRQLFRVTGTSDNEVEFRLHTDARRSTIVKKIKGARVRRSPGSLQDASARKVTVDPLGNILPAND
jgi:CRISPR-associated endonuclease Csn1